MDAAGVFAGPTVETDDRRRDYGERRVQALGVVNGRVLYVIYAWRNDRRRIISARKAGSDEQRIYETLVGSTPGD